MEERITSMYNDAWKIYKIYLSDHDMDKYNENAEKLCIKYGALPDIKGLLVWFAGRIQGLHDRYLKDRG